MAIPALVGTPLPLDKSVDGKLGIVDGSDGAIYVDRLETLAAMQKRRTEGGGKKKLLLTLKGKKKILHWMDRKFCCNTNIGNIKRPCGCQLGTFDLCGTSACSSEFIYLAQDHYQQREEQFRIYKRAAETIAGKRVIIRALDIGADKQCDYFRDGKRGGTRHLAAVRSASA